MNGVGLDIFKTVFTSVKMGLNIATFAIKRVIGLIYILKRKIILGLVAESDDEIFQLCLSGDKKDLIATIVEGFLIWPLGYGGVPGMQQVDTVFNPYM